MSIYPPPSQTGLIFDLDNWEQIVTDSSTTTTFLNANYLRYTTAQGNETFSNTINTGYSDVDGSTICNTFNTYSTPATTSLFDTTNNASQVIQLGLGQTSGTINLGKQYDGLTTYGTNRVANWTSKGQANVGSLPELNLIDATSDSYIGHNQTSGELYLGTASSRSGAISIGVDSSSTINVGVSGITNSLFGSVNIINNTTALNQTNGTLYMSDNASVLYSFIVNELNVVNVSTTTKTLTLPSTIRNFTFWVTTRTNNLIVSSPVKNIDFLCDATTSFTIKAGEVACFVASVDTDSFNLIFSNSQMYQPIRLNPDATSYAPTSVQSGFSTYSATGTVVRASGNITAGTVNLTSTALPKGVYHITIYLTLTATVVGNLSLGNLFGGCVSTTLDQSTVVNNICFSSWYPTSFANTAGKIVYALSASGYYNNATTGTIIYGLGKIDANTTNTSGFTILIGLAIRRIY